MTDGLMIAVWLLGLTIVQVAWVVFYAASYAWRTTALGPVWLAKGAALAVLWPTLLVDQFAGVPDWLFSRVVGPMLFVGTLAWLVVTVRVRLRRGEQPRP